MKAIVPSSASGVSGIFKSLLEKLQDARCLVISTPEGSELFSIARYGAVTAEDLAFVAAYVPSYAASIEQVKRINYGDARYSISWLGGNVLIQSGVDNSLIISIVCEESTNLGILDEYIDAIRDILTPLCQGFE